MTVCVARDPVFVCQVRSARCLLYDCEWFRHGRNLVDSASSHTLVSKIKVRYLYGKGDLEPKCRGGSMVDQQELFSLESNRSKCF